METKLFIDMSEAELRTFAESMLKTINSEHIFSDDISFEFVKTEVDEFNGGLWIEISTGGDIEVERPATWQTGDEDEIESGYEADFVNSIYKDVENVFKTTKVELEGYHVELDIADAASVETIEVTADNVSSEDGGIGHYDYWGHSGYDSSPYYEVEGTIVEACDCAIAFFVEPIAPASEEPTTEEEI